MITALTLLILGQQTSAPAGAYIGSLQYGKSMAELVVVFEQANPRAWIGYSSYETSGVPPLQNVKVTGSDVSFEIAPETGEFKGKISFAGKLSQRHLNGTYRSGARTGKFWLAAEVVVPGAKLQPLYGLYRTKEGRHLGIVQGSGAPGLIDYGSGMLRNLRAKSEKTFEAGPGFRITMPVEMDLSFEGSNPSKSFTLNERGKKPQVAERIPFREEKVTFSNEGITFSGTLVTPDRPGKHPVVVAVPGDYGSTRDFMRIWGHNFLVGGVGVLLYDNRGGGESTGTANASTFNQLADDLVAATQMLKTKSQVDPSHIGLFGFSNSAWTTVLAASRTRDVAFVVNHSMSAVPPWEQEIARVELTTKGEGYSEADVQRAVTLMRKKFQVARTGEGWEDLEADLNKYRTTTWLPMLNPPVSKERLITGWTRMTYDPVPALRGLNSPTLLIWGTNDVFIPVDESMKVVRATLSKDQLAQTKMVLFKNASHSIMSVRSNSLRESQMVTRFLPEYFKLVRDWVRQVTRS